MTWMQRLKQVFNIEIETREHCGGKVKVMASIEESLPHERSECFGYPAVIAHILKQGKQKEA